MYVICAACRSPLRVEERSSEAIDVSGVEPTRSGVTNNWVECQNCGSDHGSFDDLVRSFKEARAAGESGYGSYHNSY